MTGEDLDNFLSSRGWTLECESPMEIRHDGTGQFVTGRAARELVERLRAEEQPAPLRVYRGLSEEAPPPAAWPLAEALWLPHVGTSAVVTFTAFVPLRRLVQGGAAGLHAYCRQAFASDIEIFETAYRVVSSRVDDTAWDTELDGDVVLQVTCRLRTLL